MPHDVTLIPGFSPDDTPLTKAVAAVVAATGAEISWRRTSLADGVGDDVLDAIKSTGRALMPYVPVDRSRGAVPPIVELRRQLGVWGNLRPIETVPGLGGRHPDVDILIVRETTEDIYANIKTFHSSPPPPVYNMRHIHPVR